MSMTIKYNIHHQTIFRDDNSNVVADSVKYLRVKFKFTPDWDGMTKNIVLTHDEIAEPFTDFIIDDEYEIPAQIIQAPAFIMSVFAVGDGKRITTDEIRVEVKKSGYKEGTTPYPPTPSVYEQMIERMNKQAVDAKLAESYTHGGTGEREGEGTDNALWYKDETAQIKVDTQQIKVDTAQIKSDTSALKNAAAVSETNAKASETSASNSATIAANNMLNGVNAHNDNPAAHESIRDNVDTVEAIARGKANSKVFDIREDMLDWLDNPENTTDLSVGDNLYIRDIGVPDYWWDGETAQELEAEAPRLTDYYTKLQIQMLLPLIISRADYDALVTAGTVEAGRLYDIIEDGEEL